MGTGRRSGFVTMVGVFVIGVFSLSLNGVAHERTLKPKEGEKSGRTGGTLNPKAPEEKKPGRTGKTLKPKKPQETSSVESTTTASTSTTSEAQAEESSPVVQSSESAAAGAPAERARCKKILRDACGKVKKGGGRLLCCFKQNEAMLLESCPKVVAKMATNSKYRGLDSTCSTEEGAVNPGFESETYSEPLPPELN